MEKDRIATVSAVERKHVEQALAKMPPVQRERMQEALRKSGQGGAGEAGGPVRFEAMGKTGEVAGYPCSWHRAFLGNRAPGFPGIRVPISPSGQRKDEERLVKFTQGPIAPDLLLVPAGYTPVGDAPRPPPTTTP
jgi:hypothetical protein